MNNGYIQCRGSKYLCEFDSINNWADYQGTVQKISCSFQVSTTYNLDDYKHFSVINCYGSVKIFDVEIGTPVYPSFFNLASYLPNLSIILNNEQIMKIEDLRNQRDVKLAFDFKALVSLDKERFYDLNKLEEADMVFTTVIPKSKWIEEFLPKWNFYNSFEKILFFDKLNSNQNLKELISIARKDLYSDNYQGVLANCYIALEALPKQIGYKDIKEMFDKLISSGQEKEKLEYINEIYKATKEFMHLTRHYKQTGENIVIKVNKSDAILAITNTELLINYMLQNIKGF